MNTDKSKYEFIKNKTCPYCQSKIKVNADFTVCSYCGTPHHKECWDENRGCTTYGCANNPATEKKISIEGEDVGDLTPDLIRESISKTSEQQLIQCRNCSKEIEESSVYCKYCGFNQKDNKFDEAKEEFEKEYKKRYKEKSGFTKRRFYLTLSSIIILTAAAVLLSYISISKLNSYFSSDEYVIKSFVENWRDAWESKDIEKYKSFYTDDYQFFGKDGKPVDLKERVKRVESSFKNTKDVKIDLSEFKIISDSTTSETDKKVQFIQTYVSDKTREKGLKTLRIYKGEETKGDWKIYREFLD